MNFFVRPKNLKTQAMILPPEEDIVRYEVRDHLIKVSIDDKGEPDPDDYVIEKELVEVERVNRRDYINSFRDDVGIMNILKKVALSGDVTLLNQVKRHPVQVGADGKEAIVDITPLQEGEEAIAAMGDNMRKTYASMPDELKAGRSLAEFLEGVDQKEIEAFVASYVNKQKGGSEDGTK